MNFSESYNDDNDTDISCLRALWFLTCFHIHYLIIFTTTSRFFKAEKHSVKYKKECIQMSACKSLEV